MSYLAPVTKTHWIEVEEEFTKEIIVFCCILHNFLRMEKIKISGNTNIIIHDNFANENVITSTPALKAVLVREKFADWCVEQGDVDFQYKMIWILIKTNWKTLINKNIVTTNANRCLFNGVSLTYCLHIFKFRRRYRPKMSRIQLHGSSWSSSFATMIADADSNIPLERTWNQKSILKPLEFRRYSAFLSQIGF